VRTFFFLCLLWFLDIAALAAMGPLGRHLPASMALYAMGFILLIALVRSFPENLKPSRAWILVFVLGVCGRLLFLTYPPGNDIFRYIWEGVVQNHGLNPYAIPPDSPAATRLAAGDLGAVWERINHRWLTAAYPPAAMLLFRMLAAISPTVFFFKAVFILFDLGVMALLVRVLRHRGLPATRLLLYAANPLVIVFTAGEGHLDVVQGFFLCMGCVLLQHRKFAGGALALGIAAMSKYLSAVAAPFLMARGSGVKPLAVLVPLLLFVPFLDAGWGIFGSVAEFGAAMHYNDSIAAVFRECLGTAALPALGGLLFLCLAWVFLSVDDALHSVYLAVGCVLLFLPTLHPWYLVLIAPFLCVFPSRAWLYLQAAVLFTFPVMAGDVRTGIFQEIPWLKLPEYLPFYGLLVWGIVRNGYLVRERWFAPPASISVVIPVFNEAAHIERCLSAIPVCAPVCEVIVADGGSTDETVSLARAKGARVIHSEKGRGIQIAAATQAAKGDVLLIMHADSVLRAGAAERIISALSEAPDAAGGCFGMAFEGGGSATRWIARLNNLRAMVTGIAFGDQAQFARVEALRRIGGVPALMLMEDVELSLRLKRIGGAVYLKRGVIVSGRRWQQGSFRRNFLMVVGLFFRYLLKRRLGLNPDERRYYRKYYGRNI
jgi:rSAM/selenodomain-associated transferase 2